MRIPILHVHLGGREFIKIRIDANKVVLSMRTLKPKVFFNPFSANITK